MRERTARVESRAETVLEWTALTCARIERLWTGRATDWGCGLLTLPVSSDAMWIASKGFLPVIDLGVIVASLSRRSAQPQSRGIARR
jgi:hypothetical protein